MQIDITHAIYDLRGNFDCQNCLFCQYFLPIPIWYRNRSLVYEAMQKNSFLRYLLILAYHLMKLRRCFCRFFTKGVKKDNRITYHKFCKTFKNLGQKVRRKHCVRTFLLMIDGRNRWIWKFLHHDFKGWFVSLRNFWFRSISIPLAVDIKLIL